MPPSAIAMLFPKLALGGPPATKKPPTMPQHEPIYVKGVSRAEVQDQLDRYRAKMEAAGHSAASTTAPRESPTAQALRMLSGERRGQGLGSPSPLHEVQMRLRPPVATPVGIEAQPELRGLTPDELRYEAMRTAQPQSRDLGQAMRMPSQAAKTYRPGVMLREAPVGETVKNAVFMAMANGDTVRSAQLGVDPHQFLQTLWTEHFTQRGVAEPHLRATEFIEATDRIRNGEGVFEVHPDVDDLISDYRHAIDSPDSRAFDLSDTVTRLMSGYGTYPQESIATTDWQKQRASQVLDLLNVATVIDFDPYTWKSQYADPESPFTPGEAKAILRSWKSFGPESMRSALEGIVKGDAIATPADFDAALQPMQNSVQARKVQELATSGEEMWSNLQSHFHNAQFVPGSQLPGLVGDGVVKDLAIAVRDKSNPDPRNVEYYYITRGYEGHGAPDRPIVSRIVYDQSEPGFVQIKDENAPGGTRWVQPPSQPIERRIKEGPTGEGFSSLMDRLSSNQNKTVSILRDAHPVIWGGMQAIPELIAGNWTPDPLASTSDVYPIPQHSNTPIPSTPIFGLGPSPLIGEAKQGPALVRGQYVSSPMDWLNTMVRGGQSSKPRAATVSPERLGEIISSLDERDMRNVFAPGVTYDTMHRYLQGKLPGAEHEATAAAQLIASTRAANRRLWNMMELRNIRNINGELLQNFGFNKSVSIGNTDALTQQQLDEVRRKEILKNADDFTLGSKPFEQELIGRSLGVPR